DWRMFTDILNIGVPSGIQGVFRNGSRLLVISIATSTEVGTYGAAAIAIGFQVEALAFMPVLGINVAATSLVGQALGSWQTKEARQRGNLAILLGILLMLLLMIPMIVFAPAIIRLFDPTAHPTLESAGVSYLRTVTWALPLTAIAMVSNGALRGAGDSLPGMIGTMLSRGLVTLVMAYLLAFPFGFGSRGVWLGIVIGSTLEAFYVGLRWRGKRWLKVALRKTELYRQHLHYLPEVIQQQYLQEVRAPLMAEPTAQEQVEAKQVLYKLPNRQVHVHFDSTGYSVG
ncbi:MAG: MATE family efflux transporter, partial [Chloroflexota bacterium]